MKFVVSKIHKIDMDEKLTMSRTRIHRRILHSMSSCRDNPFLSKISKFGRRWISMNDVTVEFFLKAE